MGTDLVLLETSAGPKALTGTTDGKANVAISAASLPLPTGAATESTLNTANNNLVTIINNLAPFSAAEDVTLAADFTPSQVDPVRAVYVGTGGNVKVDIGLSTGITLANVPDGTTLYINATMIYSTANGTSASNLVVLG